jgi:hypothetical protein
MELINNRVLLANPLSGLSPNWNPGGALQNFHTFRSYVLSAHQKDPKLNGISNYLWPMPRNEDSASDAEMLGMLHWVPHEIASWSLCSRRIYTMTPELQAILSATSLGSLSWNDIRLPFDSYAIRLAKPIPIARGHSADFLMLTRRENGYVFFRALSPKIAQYEASNDKRKQRFQKLVKRSSYTEAIELATRELQRFGAANYGASVSLPRRFMNSPIRNTIDNTRRNARIACESEARELSPEEVRQTQEGMEAAINVAVGLALYMKTLKSKNSHSSPWKKIVRKDADPRAISSGSQLCSVTHSYKLSHQERVMLGLESSTESERAAIALAWQFVSGYWRRLPGLGNNPNAPKTEHIRSYMRRKDLMPDEEGLPGGAEQTW